MTNTTEVSFISCAQPVIGQLRGLQQGHADSLAEHGRLGIWRELHSTSFIGSCSRKILRAGVTGAWWWGANRICPRDALCTPKAPVGKCTPARTAALTRSYSRQNQRPWLPSGSCVSAAFASAAPSSRVMKAVSSDICPVSLLLLMSLRRFLRHSELTSGNKVAKSEGCSAEDPWWPLAKFRA